MNRMLVLGTEIDRISFSGAIERSLALMDRRRGDYVVTPNTEILLKARKNAALSAAIRSSALSLPDGIGIQIAARILGVPISARITGIDFASALLLQMAREEKSVFLLGAKDGVAERAGSALCEAYPGLVLSGTANGYADVAEEEKLVRRINRCAPDLLIVCLGTPKQELWMSRNASRLHVGLMAGLGGALDIFSGDAKRAPEAWRNHGLEWLFRLIREPGRLPRIVGLPRIIPAAVWQRIGGKHRQWEEES